MEVLSFPICSLMIAILLNIVFFFKKRISSKETKLYGILLLLNLVENLFALIGLCIIFLVGGKVLVSQFIVKIDYLMILLWCISLVNYVFYLAKNGVSKFLKKIIYLFFMIFNIVIMLLIIWFKEIIYVENNIINSVGVPFRIMFMACTVYIILIVICLLKMLVLDRKSIKDKKLLPLYFMIFLTIIMSIVKASNPEIVLQGFIFSFVDLIMYFTIENPDLKMIAELNIAKENAERANRAKSDFLSSMSHEIRTPLNAIVGLSEDMLSKDCCPDDMKEDLDDVVSASKTLLEIVGNIMDINKIESDKMEIVEVPYNPKKEIKSLARVQAIRIGDKNVNLKVNIAEDVPYELIGDRGHVKQIVNNLLSNAIKYTDRGIVELSVKCINQEDICNLIITCKDTGRGIKAEDINKLFTKFERLDVEKNSTTEGTGLGLAITKKLVELMGGKINVQSQFGIGSIFVCQIPQRISSQNKPLTDTQILNTAEILKKAGLKKVDYSGKKVLIVDDNKLNIKVARRSIEPLGFDTIDECYNGKECLEKINSGLTYDLILMDIMMPVMSGETALSKLKEIEGFNTPVIALTADAIAGCEEKYKSEGFIDYIAKPFSKDQIKLKLDNMFEVVNEKSQNEDRLKDAPEYVFDYNEEKTND